MVEKKIGLAELKNQAMGFDRAETRDVHVIKNDQDYLSKKHMGVWNLDKDELACLAPKSYVVIQHRYATECLIDAISSLNIKAEAVLKTSQHGIFIDFNFPESKFELTTVGERFTSGVRVVSDYSKVAGLVIAARVTRLACANGMLVNDLVKPQRIKYTEQLKISIEGIIDRIIKDIISKDEALTNMINICLKDSVEWTALKLLLKQLFMKKKHVRNIFARLDHDKERITRWDLYNAVTHYATNGERIKPHIEVWLQNKASIIMKTSFAELAEVMKPKKGEIEVQTSHPNS